MSKKILQDKNQAKSKPIKPKKEAGNIEKSRALGQTPHHLDASTVSQMQNTIGNSAVQRLLAQRSGDKPSTVDEETAVSINQSRGSGHELDADMAARVSGVMGQDFSDVTIHTDSNANQLSQQLGAKAFTTGEDIYFREGEYNPNTSDGQHLIAHELTHVVQQGASTPSVQGKMSVNAPNDQYEVEADKVADTVMSQPVQREEEVVQKQEEEEEVQMQEEEEEIQMQEEEEEVQMQEEEEEVQAKKSDQNKSR
ncbi:MAG: DUF4157 domain-containing protein [Anaerolineales bacterium]|nr:DUF4157 domain-containing protein [Anaerolineales bacterium]